MSTCPDTLIKTHIEINLRTVTTIAALWLTLGILYSTGVFLNARESQAALTVRGSVVIGTAVIFLSWAMLNVILLRCISWLANRSLLTHLAVVGVIATAWIPANLVMETMVTAWMYGHAVPTPKIVLTEINFVAVFFVTVFFLLAYLASVFWVYLQRWQMAREQSVRLEIAQESARNELERLQMQILKSQLSPHFLFNALGSVSALARSAPREKIVQTLRVLGDLLRHSLSASEVALVSLSDELEFTENYLRIQHLRFGDRYTFALHRNDVSGEIACPPFVLQTLVENAFRHGVECQQHTAIEAAISVDETTSMVRISVSNSLPPQTAVANGTGIAMDNLGRRLEHLFGASAKVVSETSDSRYLATVEFPLDTDLP